MAVARREQTFEGGLRTRVFFLRSGGRLRTRPCRRVCYYCTCIPTFCIYLLLYYYFFSFLTDTITCVFLTTMSCFPSGILEIRPLTAIKTNGAHVTMLLSAVFKRVRNDTTTRFTPVAAVIINRDFKVTVRRIVGISSLETVSKMSRSAKDFGVG